VTAGGHSGADRARFTRGWAASSGAPADRAGMRAFRDIMSTQPVRQLSIAVGRQHGCTEHAQQCIASARGRDAQVQSTEAYCPGHRLALLQRVEERTQGVEDMRGKGRGEGSKRNCAPAAASPGPVRTPGQAHLALTCVPPRTGFLPCRCHGCTALVLQERQNEDPHNVRDAQ